MAITYITHHTNPLMEGDSAPPFFAVEQHGENCILWGVAGNPVILLFLPPLASPHCEQLLQKFTQYHEAFLQAGTTIIAILFDKQEAVRKHTASHPIPYPLLSAYDLQGKNVKGLPLLMQYGVLTHNAEQKDKFDFSPYTILIDENSRIRKFFPLQDFALQPEEILREVKILCPLREVREVTTQAPVLFIDNILTKEECNHLIHVWDAQGNVDSGSMRTVEGKTVGVYDYNKKIRRDHFIKDKALLTHLDIIMRRRVFPHIKKAFHFDCSRREDYKIACYDAERGGYFRRHRDNTTPATAHRIWAMSLNLNSEDYEGGHVKFPEFSDYLYKPKTGSALIFSGSMVHEATDVRNGKRFVLLQFFYGEKEVEIREKNQHLLVEETAGDL